MRLPCTYIQTGVAFAEDQHAVGGLGPSGKQESSCVEARAETSGTDQLPANDLLSDGSPGLVA
jgi:hypothetical protein